MAAYSGSYGIRTDVESESKRPNEETKNSNVQHNSKQAEKPPFSMQSILKKIEAVGLETDDLLLALVLFLMYRESGDKDLLILLGAMLLS